MRRIAPMQIVSFFVLAACGAWCQSARPSGDLPDAPPIQPPAVAERLHAFVFHPLVFHPLVGDADSASRPGTAASMVREPGVVAPGPQNGLRTSYSAATQGDSSAFFDKYLYPSLRSRVQRYHPATSGSLMGRATYAASRIFVTRDESGKGRLNTSYFLGMLTSVTVESAYRPQWARSTSATFSNFGSTIGGDAGINVLHEFSPGIRQILRGHAPKFASSIEERITRY